MFVFLSGTWYNIHNNMRENEVHRYETIKKTARHIRFH